MCTIARSVVATSEFGQRVWPTSNILLYVSGPLDWLPRKCLVFGRSDKVSISVMYLMCSRLSTSLDRNARIGTRVSMGEFGSRTITDFNSL